MSVRKRDKPLKVVYVIDSLASGGAQRQAVELAAALTSQKAIRAAFVVYHDVGFYEPRLHEAGIDVVRILKNRRYDALFSWRLSRWILRTRPSLVHSFMIAPSCWAALALRLLPRAERPAFIASERNSLVGETLRERTAQGFAYRSSDCVTVNARPVADEIHRRLGVARARVEYVPNGIDLERWDRERQRAADFPLEKKELTIACIGRIAPQKDQRLVLEAIDRLSPKLKGRTRLWVIGDDTGEYASGVRRDVSRRRLDDIVRFAKPTRSIAGVIEGMDALVLGSRWEGFPNVVLEGMASEKPVVATSVGDVPSILDDGVTGFRVTPGDADSLAQTLERLHEMTECERLAIGRRARSIVEKRFTLRAVACRYHSLYERLVT